MVALNIGRSLGIAACAAALLLLAVAALSGTAFAGGGDAPMVTGAWIRLPVVPGRPAAAYAKISGGNDADRLVAVEGPPPSRLEVHKTSMEGGVMKMAPAGTLAVPANGAVEMRPGGLHVMVFGLPETKVGAEVPLVFVFEKAGRVGVSAHAMAANAKPDNHAHH